MSTLWPATLPGSVLLLISVCSNLQGSTHPELITDPAISGHFKLLREPSGITALDNKTLIVIEDEAKTALRRLVLSANSSSNLTFQEYDQAAGKGFIQRQLIAPLDDLEGIARLSATQFIVAGSHENASRGIRPAREKIVLFTLDGIEVTSARLRTDLYQQLDRHYPELSEHIAAGGKNTALNIEAIAFDRQRLHLHIGLRTPLIDDDAIIVRLDNALDYLSGMEPLFADRLLRLNLSKGGIRALAYDDSSDNLLIISKRESGGKKKSQLWSLPAGNREPLTRYKSEDKKLFDNVEGLTPFAEGILFVRDNGGRRNSDRNDWFILPRSQLGLDD